MINFTLARRIRVLAFDPSLTTKLETSAINILTLELPWEEDLLPGPIGEYIEVVDYDPASGVFYEPVNLNDPYLLAQDGLSPSESDPRFHQQMVYAVAMTTIRNFERALGRVVFWADHTFKLDSGAINDQFVRRLRIYPHALRERNAYYSPVKKALLFGYFPATLKDENNSPGTIIYTCLSHDIIAHEITHALLDGIHPRFNEATNPDVHAFHEAFSDIVALFQHFAYPSVLENQIQRTRGNLETENLLSQLAQQFGQAMGRGGALRDALGGINAETGKWEAKTPDPNALMEAQEPHSRGAILVAAVFRAFLKIYRAKSADLYRIATQGTGTLPEGDIHPDLMKRLASEAAKCADRVLQMCIRAIDYCPPVDITFGDFLRGVVTADLDYAPEDKNSYRVVFIQSFREWGIHPRGVTGLGLDTLVWPSGEDLLTELKANKPSFDMPSDCRQHIKKNLFHEMSESWNFESDRFEIWKALSDLRRKFWYWLRDGDSYGQHYAAVFGIIINDSDAKPTVFRGKDKVPSVEIHAVRPAIRLSVYGGVRTDYVVEITQRRRGYFDPETQKKMDKKGAVFAKDDNGDFIYRSGCTILIDQATQEVRRVIRTKGDINNDVELNRVRHYLTGERAYSDNAFNAGIKDSLAIGSQSRNEPFAMLHLNKND